MRDHIASDCEHHPMRALEAEQQDDYFIRRKLYPNVDFYSGLISDAFRMPITMYTSLFAIPRTAGWVAQ